MIKSGRHFYDFGPFRLVLDEGLLLRDGEPVPLTPKAFDTLVLLVKNSPRVIAKEEIMRTVWPDSAVEENNLTQQISALRRILGEAQPGQPYIETIPKRGYRFITAVKEGWEVLAPPESPRAPDPQTTEIEVVPAADDAPKEEEARTASKVAILTRWAIAAFALLAIGLIATLAIAKYNSSRSVHPAPLPRRSLAILRFKNLTGDKEIAWLSTALAEMFRTELAVRQGLRMIPAENIARMQRELELADADSLSADTLARVRKNIGADLLLLGSYTGVGRGTTDQVRIDVRIQDTVTGEITSSGSRAGTRSTLLDTVSQSVDLLRQDLGADATAADTRSSRESFPQDVEAQQLYTEGLSKLRLLDAAGAVPILEKAATRDSHSPLIRSALAEGWSVLGYKRKARDVAKQALELAKNIAPEKFVEIEAQYRELAREWDRALDIDKSLWTVFSDNLEYGLRFANDQIEAGKGKDALTTIARMRKVPSPVEDPRIDLTEAAAAEALGDFKREYSAAVQAATAANTAGSRLLLANALLRECWALDSMGSRKQALAAGRQAKDLFAAAGDHGGEARAVKNIADVLDDDGQHADGRKSYETAVEMFRNIGNESGVAVTMNNLAHALRNEGDLRGAHKKFEESLAISRRIGDDAREALALNGLAILMWRQEGDLAGAQRMYEEALQIHLRENDKGRAATVLGNLAIIRQNQGQLVDAKKRFEESLKLQAEIGDRPGMARTFGNRGELLIDLGDLSSAKKDFLEQLRVATEIADGKQRAYALFGIGEVLMLEGDLNGALAKHSEALKLRTDMNEQGVAAESRLAIGEILVELRDGDQAVVQLSDALREFRQEKERDQEVQAQALLAEALQIRRQSADALKVLNSIQASISKIEDISVRLATSITLGTVRAQLGDHTKAKAIFESVHAEAAKYGYRLHQIQAALALANLEDLSSTRSSRLRAIQEEAKKAGFGQIARKATVYLQQ